MSYSSCLGIIEPETPHIAIHKGWQDISRTRNVARASKESQPCGTGSHPTTSSAPESQKHARQRQFGFVNLSTSGSPKDAKVRTMVRSHARRKNHIKQWTSRSSAAPASAPASSPDRNPSEDGQEGVSLRPILAHCPNVDEVAPSQYQYLGVSHPLGLSTALCSSGWPIDMRPADHKLLGRYLTTGRIRSYPVGLRPHFSPARSRSWFQYAVTDAAMFEAMLYAGAVYLALLEGKTESWDMLYHRHQAISIVNKRLRKSTSQIADSTIGAISCLALGEAVTGNREAWDVHMRGLQQILLKRGSLASLGTMLQLKLQRSDITGAIDYGATPYLQIERSKPSIWSKLPARRLKSIRKDITKLLAECGIADDLIIVMTDLANFRAALHSSASKNSGPIDRTAYSEDVYSIESRLLTLRKKICDVAQENHTDNACRFGALLYIKAIMQEFPHSKAGSSILLRKLRESLQKVPRQRIAFPLLCWLSTIGAALSPVADKMPFVCILSELNLITTMTSLKDDQMSLSKVLPLEPIFHTTTLENLWENVLAIKGCRL